MPEFVHPAWLFALLLVPLLWLLRGRDGQRSALMFSSLQLFGASGKTVRRRSGGIASAALASLAATCWIIALARPNTASRWVEAESSGIEIMLALDISNSMGAVDFSNRQDRPVTRLEIARELCQKFIRGRAGDRIGIVVFSGRPTLLGPMTTNRQWLVERQLERVDVDYGNLEDGTAIGSAIAAAALHLSERDLDFRAEEPGDSRSPSAVAPGAPAAAPAPAPPAPTAPGRGAKGSRIIVLITDGASNAGELQPVEAAAIAARLGIRIYAIAVGSPGEKRTPISYNGTTQWAMIESYDEVSLREIARLTDGEFFQAADSRALQSAFARIDELEKSDIESYTLVEREEHHPLWTGAGLLALAVLLIVRPLSDLRLPE